jgi:biotin synthesis protein BioG
MNKHWIKRKNNPKLILFFNGWGMDAAAVEQLDGTGYDILMLNNYVELKPLDERFDSYKEIFVVAWSLGVWAASQVLSKSTIDVKQAIAINGTLKPIDEKEGIPLRIFKGTLAGWAEKTRERFLIRIAGGTKEYLKNRTKFGIISIENQKCELASIYNQYETCGENCFDFHKAVMGNQDTIFTPDNQRKSWQSKAQFQAFDMPHYPFFYFTSWEQIISF